VKGGRGGGRGSQRRAQGGLQAAMRSPGHPKPRSSRTLATATQPIHQERDTQSEGGPRETNEHPARDVDGHIMASWGRAGSPSAPELRYGRRRRGRAARGTRLWPGHRGRRGAGRRCWELVAPGRRQPPAGAVGRRTDRLGGASASMIRTATLERKCRGAWWFRGARLQAIDSKPLVRLPDFITALSSPRPEFISAIESAG